MASRIDSRTMIPLDMMIKVTITLLVSGMSVTATGAVWIFQVNTRLQRIEKQLGIVQLSSEFIASAEAQPRKDEHEPKAKKK